MTMSPAVRKFVLTAHVVASVGWIGGVAASLALGIAAVTSSDEEVVRAAYLSLQLMAWMVLVPLSVASLATGVIQSLGTSWGLFRHYWVVAKLVINLFAAGILLLYTQTLDSFAAMARGVLPGQANLGALRSPSVALHSTGALLLLLGATVLSIYKPRGMTRHGQRTQRAARREPTGPITTRLETG